MIPRTLHYIWFGARPIPAKYRRYIDGWRRRMPDWEIVCWNEQNFDVAGSAFCRQAYEAGRWAFVSDYARIKILYEHGGIYLDTDEEMVQSLDRFTGHKAFFGMETGNRLQAGVLGCEGKDPTMGDILDYYDHLQYIRNGVQDNTVIGGHLFNVLKKRYPDLVLTEQILQPETGVAIYPSRYFCPDLATLKITAESYTIHRPMGSWLGPADRIKKKIYLSIIGIKPLNRLYRKIKR